MESLHRAGGVALLQPLLEFVQGWIEQAQNHSGPKRTRLVAEVVDDASTNGIAILAGGVSDQIPFTTALENDLLATMCEMRTYLASGEAPGARWIEP